MSHTVTEPSRSSREVTGSAALDVAAAEREAPAAVLYTDPLAGTSVTAAQVAERVRAIAAALVRAGVEPGDRVLLMSRTRLEWTLTDYAIWTAGAVTVPIYETSSAEQVAWIASDSGAVAAVVETAAQRSVMEALPDGERPGTVLCVEAGELEMLPDATDAEAAALRARLEAVEPDALATIIYTSGTTGRPKGCELTHRAFLTNADELYLALREAFDQPESSTVLFLPLAHVFARIAQVACLRYRIAVAHVADPKQLPDALAAQRPTFFFAVPRVFEKLIAEARRSAAAKGARFAGVFDAAERTAIAWTRARESGRPVPSSLRVRHALFDRLVYARIRTALGGRVTHVVSAGGPLGDELGRVFVGAGLKMMEAYGLSEAICATLNRPGAARLGTVGRPVPGTAVRVDDEGRIEVSGPNVFRGYFGNPDATRDALTEDGWLRTGDLGTIDADGFLTITGREKDIIITAAGKNVSPAPLEDRLRTDPLVSQAVVVGDGKPFVGCLFTVDPEVAAAESDVDARLQRAVDRANELVSHAEAIKKFVVLPADLTEEAGELTPTQKVKRNVVAARHADAIASLYAGGRS